MQLFAEIRDRTPFEHRARDNTSLLKTRVCHDSGDEGDSNCDGNVSIFTSQ